MAISRARKEELVAKYTEMIQEMGGVFIAEYGGLNVKELEALRGKIRDAGGSLHVAKNTLIRVALEETENPVPDELLLGPTAVGFAHGELPVLAKALSDYSKQDERFALRGGVLNGQVISGDDIKALADLPSLDELRARVLGMLQAPASGLVGVLQAPPRELVSVVSAGSKQLLNVINAYAQKQEGDE